MTSQNNKFNKPPLPNTTDAAAEELAQLELELKENENTLNELSTVTSAESSINTAEINIKPEDINNDEELANDIEKAKNLAEGIKNKKESIKEKTFQAITQAKKIGRTKPELINEGYAEADIDAVFVNKEPEPAIAKPEAVEPDPTTIEPAAFVAPAVEPTIEDTRTPEQKVDEARAIYAREYLKCKKKQTVIKNIRDSIFNTFKSKDNKIKEEDYFTPELIQAKEVYNRARVEMGNEMFNKKKAEFENAGLTGADLELALTRYKATEILSRTIIEERQKLINAKAEGAPINPATWKNIVNAYVKLPRWQKVALSTMLFVGAAAGGIITGGALAGYGLASMAAVKFGSSMAIGSVTSVAVKGIDVLKRKKDAEFKTRQDNKLTALKNQFASGEITLEQLEEFEKGAGSVVEEEKKRARNRMLLKAGVGVAIAGSAGWLAAQGMGPSNNTESVVDDNTIRVQQPPTQPVFVDTTPVQQTTPEIPIDTQAVEKPIIDTNTTKIPKTEEIKVIKPHEGVWDTGGEKTISPTKGQFETNTEENIEPKKGDFNIKEKNISPTKGEFETSTDKNIAPKKGEFNTGEETTPQTPIETGKSEFETNNTQAPNKTPEINTLNTGKPVELSKPINLSDGTSEFEKANPQVAPTAVDQTIPKTSTSQFETNNPQTIQTPESEFELKNPQESPVANTETITEQPVIKAPVSEFETKTPQTAPVTIDQQTIKTPGVSEFEKVNTQTPPTTGITEQSAPKVSTSQFETNPQVAPKTPDVVNQSIKTPTVTEANLADQNAPTRIPPGSISPTQGVFNTTANGTENFSNPTTASPDINANDNGFTRTGNLTRNESQIGTEDIDAEIKSGRVYESESGPKTMTMRSIESDGRNLETIKDLRKEIGRYSFKHDVIVVKPVDETINGIEYNKWNDATDYTLKAKNIKFDSYESYEKERELQALFGEGKEVIRGGNKFIDMDYFRETPEWKIVNKIPAKYFFDFENAKEIVGNKLVDIPKVDLDKLIESGIIEDQVVEINGVPTHSYTFVNRTELLRLSDTYEQWNSEYARPVGNETIERYVARITRDVHQTDDGTFFLLKKDIILENNVVDTDGRVVNLEDRAVRNIQRSGNISPTRGVYQTSSGYYSPNSRLASRAADIFSRSISSPTQMWR